MDHYVRTHVYGPVSLIAVVLGSKCYDGVSVTLGSIVTIRRQQQYFVTELVVPVAVHST